MGFIPIFVALLGLILLYTIYIYNQIKPRKVRLTQVIDQMAANSGQRKMAIFKFDEDHSDTGLSDAAEALRKTSTDRFQSFKKEEELIAIVSQGIISIEDEQLKEFLTKSNKAQEQLMKKLRNYANDYNRLIGKAPASFVASVFGFKTF